MIEFICNTTTVVDFADTVSKHKECQQIQSDCWNEFEFVFGFVDIIYASVICAEQNESDVENSELLNSSGMCMPSEQNLRRSWIVVLKNASMLMGLRHSMRSWTSIAG